MKNNLLPLGQNGHENDIKSRHVEIFSFVNEVETDRAQKSTLIAWTLEQTALRDGWQSGAFVGTEGELIDRFNVSRETLREAIRMIEARGSMRMQRGRWGGLKITSPSLDDVADAFATHLHCAGFTHARLQETAAIIDSVFTTLNRDDLVVRLYYATLDRLFTGMTSGTRHAARAEMIAAQLIRNFGTIPENGIYLGDETRLCERLDYTRPAFREGLRVLSDLGMLRARRGRGGGFVLLRPSPNVAVRRLFGLIASHHPSTDQALSAIRTLNLIRLRLAILQLCRLDRQAQASYYDLICSGIRTRSEPDRWFFLYARLGQIANNRMINALVNSYLFYLARLESPSPSFSAINEELKPSEDALIHALWSGDEAEAERLHLSIHAHINRALSLN
jgi:DNA-binding FadR family transcriptional regulator